MKAIIIDDELSARLTLRSILEGFFPEVEIIGEAGGPAEAAKLLETHSPDVIFLDIQMGAETGFDLLESISNRTFQVIIISAHRQHAFDSFRYRTTDYLLKPVRIQDMRAALDKVKDNIKPQVEEDGTAMLRSFAMDQSRLQLVIPEADGFTLVKLSDIIYLEGDSNYTIFHMEGNHKITAAKTLREFEDLLASHNFVRIHRSHVINPYHLIRYIRGRGGEVVMNNGVTLTVARERKEQLLQVFLM